jgi:hypothetical protein
VEGVEGVGGVDGEARLEGGSLRAEHGGRVNIWNGARFARQPCCGHALRVGCRYGSTGVTPEA